MNAVIACVLVCGVLAAGAHDTIVKPGAKIDEVSAAMLDAGYKETSLAIASAKKTHRLKMWDVGNGVLICTFREEDNTVTAISFFLCDERAKSARKEFDFTVKEFYPLRREMKIILPKKLD